MSTGTSTGIYDSLDCVYRKTTPSLLINMNIENIY